MIFNSLDFHPETERRIPAAVERAYRIRTNHVVDSFSLRIPKKIRTKEFHKLNVCAYEEADVARRFWAVEGIAIVELRVPDIASIYRASQPQAARRVKQLLRIGIDVAAKDDPLFAKHLKLWRQLLATTGEEFDYDLGISRSHRTRRWRADAVLRITAKNYHYDLLIKESRTGKTIERHRIKTTECALPFYEGVGFSKLRWDGQDVVVLTKDDDEVARFETSLPA